MLNVMSILGKMMEPNKKDREVIWNSQYRPTIGNIMSDKPSNYLR